jgi:hypothetical protein
MVNSSRRFSKSEAALAGFRPYFSLRSDSLESLPRINSVCRRSTGCSRRTHNPRPSCFQTIRMTAERRALAFRAEVQSSHSRCRGTSRSFSESYDRSADVDLLPALCVENPQSPLQKLDIRQSRNAAWMQPANFPALAVQETHVRGRERREHLLEPLELLIRCVRLSDGVWFGRSVAGNMPQLPEFCQRWRRWSGQLGVSNRETLRLYPELDLQPRRVPPTEK